jgi:hypothetical protein
MLPEGILLCLCAVNIKGGGGGTQEHTRLGGHGLATGRTAIDGEEGKRGGDKGEK